MLQDEFRTIPGSVIIECISLFEMKINVILYAAACNTINSKLFFFLINHAARAETPHTLLF